MPKSLRHKHILITAGPTWEMLDPVRFLSNRSSGQMGFALAKAAKRAGAQVTLVTGPVTLPDPKGVRVIRVVSARDMHRECLKHFPKTDIVIMTAAVADYRPANVATHKIKKTGKSMTIKLVRNPDILATLGKRKTKKQLLAGFALESRNMMAYAKDKLRRKKCDVIVANGVPAINARASSAVLIFKNSPSIKIPQSSKAQLAVRILKNIVG